MGRIILITSSEPGPRAEKIAGIFKLLGMEVKKFSEVDKEQLHNYEIILVEDGLYLELKTRLPHKIIVPLIQLERKDLVIFRRIQELIKGVVGEVILQ